MMRFRLQQSLQELAQSNWLKQRASEHFQTASEPLNAIQQLGSWATSLTDLAAAPAGQHEATRCVCPHLQLIKLSEVLLALINASECPALAALANGKALLGPLMQLAAATTVLCGSTRRLLQLSQYPKNPAQCQLNPMAHTEHPSSTLSDVCNSEAIATCTEHLKEALYWLCQLVMAAHKVFVFQTRPAPIKGRQGARSNDKSQQDAWLQHKLPVMLQHLEACYRLIAGFNSTSTDNLADTDDTSIQHINSCSALQDDRDRVAADRLLLSTCMALLSARTAAFDAPRQCKIKAAASAGVALPAQCMQSAAGLIGCHLLFRHNQLVQQEIATSDLTSEVCRMLGEQQLPLMQLLPQAFAGLLLDTNTEQQGSQLLCCLADAAFPQQGRAATGSRQPGSVSNSLLLLQMMAEVFIVVSSSTTAAPAVEAAAGSPYGKAQLLAAAMLPKLLPALKAGSKPAARKQLLAVASSAAMCCVPSAAAASNSKNARAVGCAAAGTASIVGLLQLAHQPQLAAACAAADAYSAGVAVLATVAMNDNDANVRCKALALLQDLATIMWHQLAYWRHQQHQGSLQLQQQGTDAGKAQHDSQIQLQIHVNQHWQLGAAAAGMQTAVAVVLRVIGTEVPSTASGRMQLTAAASQQLQSSFQATTAALQSQLCSSSKACRTKALHLLQAWLANPADTMQYQCPGWSSTEAAAAAAGALRQHVRVHQQQLCAAVYPQLSIILAAPQDSPLYCTASKAAVQGTLSVMAKMLEPQQALQMVLACSHINPAAAQQLLACLSACDEHAIYQVLRQQLKQGLSADQPAIPAALGDQHVHASAQQQLQQRAQLLPRLQRLLSDGSCSSEPLRRHALLVVCQSLTAGMQASTVIEATTGKQEKAEAAATQNGNNEHSPAVDALQQHQQLLHTQENLLLAVQLLELAGGCMLPTLDNAKDLKAELAILADALDLCCHWMQQAAIFRQGMATNACSTAATTVAAVAADAEFAASQVSAADGQPMAGRTALHGDSTRMACLKQPTQWIVCLELLSSLLRIVHKAAEAVHGRQAAGSAGPVAAVTPATAAAPRCATTITMHQKDCSGSSQQGCRTVRTAAAPSMWVGVGRTLHHHLHFMLLLTSPVQAKRDVPRLPISKLGIYIQVLCAASMDRQLLLHNLLTTWHKELSNVDSASLQGAQPEVKLAAFLFLLQHLAGLYELAKQQFQQRLLATIQHSAPDSTTTAAVGSKAAASGDVHVEKTSRGTKRQHQDCLEGILSAGQGHAAERHSGIAGVDDSVDNFDYMLGEEQRHMVAAATGKFVDGLMGETAPACYVPLLLQLLQAPNAPEHVKVLALQALQPLLLVSDSLAAQQSMVLAALLSDPSTPPGLQLQAVHTAGSLIAARPAQSHQLVQQLQHLLLQGLARADLAAQSAATDGQVSGLVSSATGSDGHADAVATASPAAAGGMSREHTVCKKDVQQANSAQQLQSGTSTCGFSQVLTAAAGVYCELLLRDKLLLAGTSWSVVAAGLVALPHVQGVSAIMQQLIRCLLTQQRTTRIKAVLGLFINHIAAFGTAGSNGNNSFYSSKQTRHTFRSNSSYSNAVALVKQHLLGLLSPKDLTSEELMLPLLQSLDMAAGSGWADAEATAALLAACRPTPRCLETIMAICTAHKHSMAKQCSPNTLALLHAYVQNRKDAGSSVAREVGSKRSKAAADTAGSDRDDEGAKDDAPGSPAAATTSSLAGATQAKVLQLLENMVSGGAVGSADSTESTINADAALNGMHGGVSAQVSAAGRRTALKRKLMGHMQQPDSSMNCDSAAAAGRRNGKGRPANAESGAAVCDALQRLLAEREQQLQQYRANKLV